MPDHDRLRQALRDRHPDGWVEHHLASFRPEYFEAFEPDAIARHLTLMRTLANDHPVAIEARPVQGRRGHWWLEVVGFDAFQFLSTVCTLLAVRGLTIREGRVFTSEPPPLKRSKPSARSLAPGRTPKRSHSSARRDQPDQRRKVVDVFRVQQLDPKAEPPDWDEFLLELTSMTELLRQGRFQDVHHCLIDRFVLALGQHRSSNGGRHRLDVRIDPHQADFATKVCIKGRGSFGFLSLMANALALCGVRIVQAEIHTKNGRAEDVIWVTNRSGRRLESEAEVQALRLALIVIEHFSRRLPRATNPELALLHFGQFVVETMTRPDWSKEFAALDREDVLDALVCVLGDSEFLWEDYLHAQRETILPLVCDPKQWRQAPDPSQLAAELRTALEAAAGRSERTKALRRFKDREIFRADARAILGQSTREEFSAELTAVAEVLIVAAFELAAAEVPFDPPRRADGRPAPSALFALGKFGGRELGFASDLELMLVYDDRDLVEVHGQSVGDYFDRLAPALSSVLGSRRGGTFELDYRLRPYGRSGPPATSLSAFQNYYQSDGGAWGYERQALIKLRPVAGDPALSQEVERLRDQFVFGPEPFDLSGYRKMRELQVRQLVEPGTINAKFSLGALVDVEYIVQILQIHYGSSNPTVRTPNTLEAISALATAGVLDHATSDHLREGYCFFRTLIDELRVVHGHAKDLTVPPSDSREFLLLTRRMNAPRPSELQTQIAERLQTTLDAVRRLAHSLEQPRGAAG